MSVRDGDELGRATLQPTAQSTSPAKFAVDGIDTHDVIDVTFINPNDEPVICSSCTVLLNRQIRTTATRMSTEMFLRVYNGAIASLAPTLTVSEGQVRLSLQGEIAKQLGISSITRELPVEVYGGATFEPRDLEIMSSHEMISEVIVQFQVRLAKAVYQDNLSNSMQWLLILISKTVANSSTFVDDVADAYFDPQVQVFDAVLNQITPEDSFKSLDSHLRAAVRKALEGFPILNETQQPHRPADPAFVVGYALTEIRGNAGPISLEVPSVRATAYLAFHHWGKFVPAPFGDLPLDGLWIGSVRPSFHLALDISDFDVDIDVPEWVTFVTSGLANLWAWMGELGLEALGNYLAGQAEQDLPRAAHDAIASRADEFGELITETLSEIADRDHYFHRTAANRGEIVISMIDPNQLRVPHDPSAGVTPSVLQGIGEQASAVTPIDHEPTVRVSSGASPENLLSRITHFVFVMMENRSFDHMLGHLSHPEFGGRTDVDGLDGAARDLGGDLTGTRATPLAGPYERFTPNLPHDFDSTPRQINAGQMNGFASEYGRRIYTSRSLNPRTLYNDPERALRFQHPRALRFHQDPDVLSTYERLARDYTICDRWFSSVPAGTYPNRACYYSGVTPALFNKGMDFGYLDDITIFDILDSEKVDWKVFESDITFLRVFRNFRIDQDRIRPISEMTDPLPTVTFIDPAFTGFPSELPDSDDQPPTSVRAGQAFLDRVVRFVENSSHWDTTMLVITYDEHGGFADHVPPPGAPGSSHPPEGPVQISRSHPDASTYGVRVPAFVVSPLAARGGVSHKIFDHAAVFRTLLQRFAPQHVNSALIPERVRRSRHLGEVLVDQPLLSPVASVMQPFMAAKAPPRARVTFAEEPDPEDLVYALNQIGRPSLRARDRD